MSDTLAKIETPQWMLDLFKAIDTLDLSEGSGFKAMKDDIDLQFGPSERTQGIDNVKKWFAKLDGPFITEHIVDVVYSCAGGTCYVMQGTAKIRKKDGADTFEVKPLMNIFWLDDADKKIVRYIVDFPPAIAKANGM